MKIQLLFIIGTQRSGTTMLERILSTHSLIQGGPETHLLTPLAHLGVWAKVDNAPYDHIVAALGQCAFVEKLPNKKMDYWRACRAYCDVLYESYMANTGKPIYLEKTPEYATVLPFITKVFPDAKYIVLTRHPVAIFSSFANSFFDGDYAVAQSHDPLLNRYVPPMAAFLRQTEIPFIHLRYEDMVQNPEIWMERIYKYIGIPFEHETINYHRNKSKQETGIKLGDPIGVKQHTKPSTSSMRIWAEELAADTTKLKFMQDIIKQLAPADLTTIGYPPDELWKPLEESGGLPPIVPKLNLYRLERRLIVKGRGFTQRHEWFRTLLKKIRLSCDVLLREY